MFSGLRFVKTNLELNAKIAKTGARFPIIIFSPGRPVLPRSYTWLLEELASYGFVVVGINHTYLTNETHFPDGRTASWVYPKMKKQLMSKAASGELSKKESKKQHMEWRAKLIDTYVSDIHFAINKIQELTS